MKEISTTEVHGKVKKNFRDPDINFPGNGKFNNAKFSVLTLQEETLATMIMIITHLYPALTLVLVQAL